MTRYECVEEIFNGKGYRVLTSNIRHLEATEEYRPEIDLRAHLKPRGTALDPSGGFFVQEEDLSEHDSLLLAALNGQPIKFASEEFDKMAINDLNEFYLTVNGIVEHFDLFSEVVLVDPSDSVKIYELILNYLESLDVDGFMSLNSSSVPEEDIVKLKSLARAIEPLVNETETKIEIKNQNPNGL